MPWLRESYAGTPVVRKKIGLPVGTTVHRAT
jgi:hypothetical protein